MFVAMMEVEEVRSKIHVTCQKFGMFVMLLWNHVYGLTVMKKKGKASILHKEEEVAFILYMKKM
jgi:hypothetical protein